MAPLLTVYGGKITTYRRLAEDVLARLSHFFPRSRPWTANSPLPGGDFAYDGVAALVERTQRRWPFLTDDHARRLVGAYGTRVEHVLGNGDAARRSRRALRRRSHRRRGALSDDERMGADRRRRALAPLQARLAAHAGTGSHPRSLHGVGAVGKPCRFVKFYRLNEPKFSSILVVGSCGECAVSQGVMESLATQIAWQVKKLKVLVVDDEHFELLDLPCDLRCEGVHDAL